jgi:hypothetical protein
MTFNQFTTEIRKHPLKMWEVENILILENVYKASEKTRDRKLIFSNFLPILQLFQPYMAGEWTTVDNDLVFTEKEQHAIAA